MKIKLTNEEIRKSMEIGAPSFPKYVSQIINLANQNAQGTRPRVVGQQRNPMILHNEDIKELITEIPDGHRHLRTTVVLQDGTELVFQEATIANLVRAYITVKTHPTVKRVVLKGKRLDERKEGYAEWQIVEEK